jgi:hypothetical protein
MILTDATPTGERLQSFTVDQLAERMTVREIIRARIWQEVSDHNRREPARNRGPVLPTATEVLLNGSSAGKRGKADWEAAFDRACTAFESNGFFVIVGDRQAEFLDEAFEIGVETEIQFVRLMPLVGG